MDCLALDDRECILEPLQVFNRTMFATRLCVELHRNRSQPVVNTDHRKANALILNKENKNSLPSIINALSILLNNKLNDYRDGENVTDCSNTILEIFGSGGAPSMGKEFPPT